MTVTIYIILAITILATELNRRRQTSYDALLLVNILFLLNYVLTPLYVLTIDRSILDKYTVENIDSEITAIVVFLSYLVFYTGWLFARRNVIPLKATDMDFTRLAIKFSWLGTIIFLLAVFIYFQSFGGLKQALVMGALKRFGYEEIELGFGAFAKNILPIGKIVFYYSFIRAFLVLDKPKTRQWHILFYLLLATQLVVSLVLAGRGSFLLLVVPLFFIYSMQTRSFALKKLGIMVVFVVIFGIFGKQLFFSASSLISSGTIDAAESFSALNDSRNKDATPLSPIIKETVHNIVALEAALTHAGDSVEYTYFKDFFWAVLRIIPQRVYLSVITPPPSTSTANTLLISGLDGSSIPPGLLGQFVYSAGLFGLSLGMFLYGYLGSLLNNTILNQVHTGGCAMVYYVLFSLLYAQFVGNGDPSVFIYDIIMPVLSLAVMWRVASLRRSKYW